MASASTLGTGTDAFGALIFLPLFRNCVVELGSADVLEALPPDRSRAMFNFLLLCCDSSKWRSYHASTPVYSDLVSPGLTGLDKRNGFIRSLRVARAILSLSNGLL
jgi:hypothetical protein